MNGCCVTRVHPNKFFRPLLIGKFGDEYQKVNMAWMWARVKTRSLKLGTFVGGFQAFLDTLADAITKKGATICLNTPVAAIGTTDRKPTLTIHGETLVFDRVLATTSPGCLLPRTRTQNMPYGNRLVNSAVSARSASSSPLSSSCSPVTPGSTFQRPVRTNAKAVFTSVSGTCNWMDRSHYSGDHILYCGDYGRRSRVFQVERDEIAERFIATIHLQPQFKRDWVKKYCVSRTLHTCTLRQSQRENPVAGLLSGVYWASMATSIPGIVYKLCHRARRRVAKLMTEPSA
jgi:protoporphyrinogen oxidase